MIRFCFGIILINSWWVRNAEGNADYDAPIEIKLYHTLDPSPSPEWSENGVVTLQNINTGNVVISQPPIKEDFAQKLKESSNEDGIYRLKSVVKTSKGREITFYSFLKVNTLLQAGHTISIIASLDHNGSIIGIKAFPDIKKSSNKLSTVNASLAFKTVEQGPLPDTASYILKLEREREAKERGANQDNRSFIAKYWMYLVPVVLFAVLSGAANGDNPSTAAR